MSYLDRLSVQLYSGRKFPPLENQLATLEALGYRKVEPYGGLLENPDEMGAALRRHNLAAPSCHIGMNMLRGDFDGAVRAAKAIGVELLIVPAIGPDERPATAEGWRAFGRELAGIQAALRPHGIRLAWHNHDFEFEQVEGRYPLDLIFEGAPDLLWETDIGWVTRAGQPAPEWIAKYRDRIVALHVKDIAPEGENEDQDGWTDVGAGIIDWHALEPALNGEKVELLVLEHDNPADFDRFVRRSREAIAAW